MIKKTQDKKVNLLQVLDQAETPLNNNPAELGARARVRDVSFGPRSGVAAWDIFMTLAKKLDVSFWGYIFDRISGTNKMLNLSDLIASQRSEPEFLVNSS